MKGLKVLPANFEDIDFIKSCQRKTFSEVFGRDEVSWPQLNKDQISFEKQIKSKLLANPFQALILFQESERIGAIVLADCLSDSRAGHVEMYFLEKAFRGKGIGLFMESVAIRYFQQQGANELRISVATRNLHAIRYLDKMGYQFFDSDSADTGFRLAKKEISQTDAEIYLKAHQFLKQLWSEAESLRVKLDDLEIDHLCFRTLDEEHYRKVCHDFENIGELLIESLVNSRLISTYQLRHPILFRGRTINLVEITSPKKGKTTISGFEHIEIVLKDSFESFIKLHPQIDFDCENVTKEKYPEIQIQLQSGAIKFHFLSLMNIVELEKNLMATKAITALNFHHLLSEYKPTVVGTYPLALETSSSDIDVICHSQDIEGCVNKLKENYRLEQSFDSEMTARQGFVQFSKDGFKFEFFISPTLTVYQAGLRHLVIENLLLKIVPQLRSQILQLKLDGIKTEPAFAQALNIPGDSYSELLKMDSLSESELRRTYGISLF